MESEEGTNRVRRESYYSWRQRLRKTKEAADKYDGPVYKPSDWKTGRADEIVWGVANYKRSLLYKRNPDKGRFHVTISSKFVTFIFRGKCKAINSCKSHAKLQSLFCF